MVVAILVLFLVSLGQGVTLPLLPSLSESGSDQARLLGFVYGSFAGARIVTQPLGGAWVDRVGGERVMAFAACLYTLSLSGFLVTSSATHSLGLRVLGGVASGLLHPATFALAMEGVPVERQGRRMATVLGIGTTGMVVGPVLAALFSARHLRLPLVIALIPTVLVTVGLVTRELVRRRRAPATPAAGTRSFVDELRGMRALFLDASLVAIVLPVAFNKITFSAFQALLPLHGEEVLHLGRPGVSLLFLLTGVCFAAIQPVGGFLADRFPPRAICLTLTPALLAVLATMVSPAVSGRVVPFFVSYLAYIVISSLIFVATLKLLTKTYGAQGRMGGLYGSAATLTDPFTVLGPIVFMNAYAATRQWTFGLMAAVGVVSGLLFAWYTKRHA